MSCKNKIIPRCIKGIKPGKPGAKNARKPLKREAPRKAKRKEGKA